MSEEKKESKTKPKKFVASVADESTAKEPGETEEEKLPGFVLETDRVLNPISKENPAGEHLIYEGTYDRIQEARREDDASIPVGVWEKELKKADWQQVNDTCLEILETRSKDLQVAAWLLEALIHLHKFPGVREGLKLLLELCQTFWDSLHPEIGDNDLEARISPLIWMNEKLSLKLKFVPITMPAATDSAVYTYADWESANELEKLAAKDAKLLEKAEAQNKVTRTKFLGSVMFTHRSFYIKQHQDLSTALEYLTALNEFLEEKCGQDGPSLTQFRNRLQDIHALVSKFLQEKEGEIGGLEDASSIDGASEEARDSYGYGKGDEMKYVTLSIRSRAEAYRMLSDASDYLLIHEPHSPTPYLVKRAVSWGGMTLTQLLRELINDDQDLKTIYSLLGLRAKPTDIE